MAWRHLLEERARVAHALRGQRLSVGLERGHRALDQQPPRTVRLRHDEADARHLQPRTRGGSRRSERVAENAREHTNRSLMLSSGWLF